MAASTEGLCRNFFTVDRVAKRLLDLKLEKDDIFVGSLDAVSLYPSLVIEEVGKIYADKVKESGVKFENADITWACKYVALAMDENEVSRRELNDVIPRRKARQGKKAMRRTVVMSRKDGSLGRTQTVTIRKKK